MTDKPQPAETSDVPYAALLDVADEIISTVLTSGRGFEHDRKHAADIIQRALKTPAFTKAKTKTAPPRPKPAPSVVELIEWLDWYQSNIIKPSSDRHWIGQIRQFLDEVRIVTGN